MAEGARPCNGVVWKRRPARPVPRLDARLAWSLEMLQVPVPEFALPKTLMGGCPCGHIHFTATGASDTLYTCLCRMCARHSCAPAVWNPRTVLSRGLPAPQFQAMRYQSPASGGTCCRQFRPSGLSMLGNGAAQVCRPASEGVAVRVGNDPHRLRPRPCCRVTLRRCRPGAQPDCTGEVARIP